MTNPEVKAGNNVLALNKGDIENLLEQPLVGKLNTL